MMTKPQPEFLKHLTSNSCQLLSADVTVDAIYSSQAVSASQMLKPSAGQWPSLPMICVSAHDRLSLLEEMA